MREGADCTADRDHGDLGTRGEKALAVAGELGVMAGQFEAESGGFSVDAVAAADGDGVFVLERSGSQRRHDGVDIFQQDVGGLSQLHRQRGVQHVGTGHALVHEAGVGTHRLGQPGQEGDDVMAGLALDRVDPFDVRGIHGRQFGSAFLADGAGGFQGDRADPGHPLGGEGFHFEPDSIAVLRRPDGGHFGSGVTRNHCFLVRSGRKGQLDSGIPEGKHGVDAGPGGAGPGDHDRRGSGGGQRRGRRFGRRRAAVAPAAAGNPAGYRGRHGDPHRHGRGGAAVAGDDRAAACRRCPAAVGLLENVSRVAASPSRRRCREWKDAAAGDDADHPGGCLHESGQRPGRRRRGA